MHMGATTFDSERSRLINGSELYPWGWGSCPESWVILVQATCHLVSVTPDLSTKFWHCLLSTSHCYYSVIVSPRGQYKNRTIISVWISARSTDFGYSLHCQFSFRSLKMPWFRETCIIIICIWYVVPCRDCTECLGFHFWFPALSVVHV